MNASPHRRGAVTNIITRVILGIIVLWAFGSALFMATHPMFCLRAGAATNKREGGFRAALFVWTEDLSLLSKSR